MKKIILGICLCLLVIGTAGFAWLSFTNVYTLELHIQGDEELLLEFGTPYEDPGAVAQISGTVFYKNPRPVDVEVSHKVNENRLGTYVVTYSASSRGQKAMEHRKVTVVDTTPPVIQLIAADASYVLPGHPYIEDGFTATDNCDGDLTAAVQRTETEDSVIYTVTDAAGNTAEVTRKLVFNDPLPPVLELKGDAEVVLKAGDRFEDPGFAATDNCEGDLTAAVAVNNPVDSYIPGTYTVTYQVSDSSGNKATATRTVQVLELPPDFLGGQQVAPANGCTIYLTFDDGPSPYTDKLLDVLAKYNVKATFFVVNTGYIGKVERMAQEGHTVALHTATHRFQDIYVSEQAFFNDLYSIQDIVEEHTGQRPMLMRFAGGSSNTISSRYSKGIMGRLSKLVQEEGFCYFDWNVDSDDAGRASTSQEVFDNVTGGVQGHKKSVVLQHDIFDYSVDAVEDIIIWGLSNGYRFAPLTADAPGCHHPINN